MPRNSHDITMTWCLGALILVTLGGTGLDDFLVAQHILRLELEEHQLQWPPIRHYIRQSRPRFFMIFDKKQDS